MLYFDCQCSRSMRQQMLISSAWDICCKKTEGMYYHNMAATYLLFPKFLGLFILLIFVKSQNHPSLYITKKTEGMYYHNMAAAYLLFPKFLLRSHHPIYSRRDFCFKISMKIEKSEILMLKSTKGNQSA